MSGMDARKWTRVKEILDACLDLEPEQQSGFLAEHCAGDDGLRAEVESLLRSHREAGDFIAEPVLRESFLGVQLGHWKIVADIGEGGMSRVCLAERSDGQYAQQAAIKILKRGMDTDLIVRHFQLERQILAKLQHPNIARLLDGGVTAGGRPYFVMEYIEGERIDTFTDRVESPGALLKLFLQVCSAVHYAHQRLVIHRDLKPSNILATPDGTAKLLDFGIATIISPEPALGTLSAAQLLTPEYASPEQIRGEPVTTASDVYSLGVLLFKLMTGHNPYLVGKTGSSSPQEFARAICERESATPSAVAKPANRRGLSGDLDNIILKTLEKDPQNRYASAEQLAQDIQRHLDGQPVLARRQTLRYRSSKFIARNKLGVAAAALMVVLLIGGLAATLWEARIAGIERRRSEAQLAETRQLAKSLLFEVHDAIRDLPGSTKARSFIIQQALQYLDRTAAQSPGNAALQLELAEGYKRLGDVQGRKGDAHLGEYASAETSYRKALALLQFKSDPAMDRQRRRLLAITLLRLGKKEDEPVAIQILEDLRQTASGDVSSLKDLAAGYSAVADKMVERRDLEGALKLRSKEWVLQKMILEVDSGDGVSTRNYALTAKRLGALLWRLHRPKEAMGYYETALRMEERLSAAEPANADAKMAVSFSHSDIGFFLAEAGRIPEALAHYGKTVAIREALAAADPNNARASVGLISAYWRTAIVYAKVPDRRPGLMLLDKAVATLAKAKNPAPGSARSRSDLASIQATYGALYAAAGNGAAARSSFEKAKQLFLGLRASGELDANGADQLAAVMEKLAKAPQY